MATILSFTPRPQREKSARREGDAAVVIFPGVRYELKEGIDRALAKLAAAAERPEDRKPR